jgi:hypothetical protein
VRRRDFLALLGRLGAAVVTLPLPALAQGAELSRFLQVSAGLCGVPVESLDPGSARIYLEALRGPGLDRLLAGRQDPVSRAVLECWYTGVCGGQTVDFAGALAWSALGFAGPPTVCHPDWPSVPLARPSLAEEQPVGGP